MNTGAPPHAEADGVLGSAKAFGLLARDAGVRWADDACYRLGASLSYYTLFSLLPLVLLSVAGMGFVLGSDDGVRQRLVESVTSAVSPEFRALLDQTLQNMQAHRTARGVGAFFGAVMLLFGASGVFSELQCSLDFIWRVKSAPSKGIWSTILEAVRVKAFSFAIVVAAATALLASLVVSTTLGAIGDTATSDFGAAALVRIVETGVSVAFLALLLAATYRFVPQTQVTWRDVVGAAALTSFLFAGLQSLLAWYLAHVVTYAAYGVVGGVLGLLTWIYVASLVLFYGAEFSRVYAERFGSLRPPASARNEPSKLAASPRGRAWR
jgi:membrane protein